MNGRMKFVVGRIVRIEINIFEIFIELVYPFSIIHYQ